MFAGLPEKNVCWMSHNDYIETAAPGFKIVASTPNCPFTENSANLFTLVFTQQAVINKYAGQLLANSLCQHCSANAGVYTAGQSAQHLAVADFCLQLSNSLLNEGIHLPGAGAAADIVNEIAQHLPDDAHAGRQCLQGS